jgi:hypothetical protein
MEGEPWRAVFTENGQQRHRQAATEARLAAKLEKVRERLEADAPNLERPGADLITYYLAPERLPADRRWSRKYAHTQRRLCERFAAPVIGMVTCQDIRTWHMQQIANAAPTAGEGARVAGMISALVSAGIVGGYLASPLAAESGPGTACGTCSALLPVCSPGAWMPPTCPGWPATPTCASLSTCMWAPSSASSIAPAKRPPDHARHSEGPGRFI